MHFKHVMHTIAVGASVISLANSPSFAQTTPAWPDVFILVHGYASTELSRTEAAAALGKDDNFWYWKAKYSNGDQYDVPSSLREAALKDGKTIDVRAVNWGGVNDAEYGANQLVTTLNQYCLAKQCDLVGHSTGDLIIGYTLDKKLDPNKKWKIGRIFVTGGAGGGTEAAVGEFVKQHVEAVPSLIFHLSDPIVQQLVPTQAQALYNHDMHGPYANVPNIRFVGAGKEDDFAYGSDYSKLALILPGWSDGLVTFYSQGGVSKYYGDTNWPVHQNAYCHIAEPTLFSCGALGIGNSDAIRVNWFASNERIPKFKGYVVQMLDDARRYNHSDEIGWLSAWIPSYIRNSTQTSPQAPYYSSQAENVINIRTPLRPGKPSYYLTANGGGGKIDAGGEDKGVMAANRTEVAGHPYLPFGLELVDEAKNWYRIRTCGGQYLKASGGGGGINLDGALSLYLQRPGPHEAFVVEKVDAASSRCSLLVLNQVALRTSAGYYLIALGGGGRDVPGMPLETSALSPLACGDDCIFVIERGQP